jgi:hypothetical protein
MDFQSIHITYNFQHFEPIQYGNGLSRSLPTFQVNDPKVTINLNEFPSLLELMVQQPLIQLSQLDTHFYWNEKINFAILDILKYDWDSQLEYVISLFNTCNTSAPIFTQHFLVKHDVQSDKIKHNVNII